LSTAVVLGGGGFIGSHLVDRLLAERFEVVAVDDYVTGRRDNLAAHPKLRLVEHDICKPIPVVGPLDVVFNLASPASPVDYERLPLETLEAGSAGTRNALELARRSGAALVHASTSEVYGDPLEHPQRETYYGNVNPVGPRACYDEAKRYAEALVTTYARVHGTTVQIARIFNTYGPRMRKDDGRVVPAFVSAAIERRDFEVFGDGRQTRSFCYVDDLVSGLVALWKKGDGMPVNLGNDREITLLELADLIRRIAGSGGKVRSVRPLPQNDPRQRRPDLSRTRSLLGWTAATSLEDGLRRTVEWFRRPL
jgi:dTDP-glucose 4,6-dehydratase